MSDRELQEEMQDARYAREVARLLVLILLLAAAAGWLLISMAG